MSSSKTDVEFIFTEIFDNLKKKKLIINEPGHIYYKSIRKGLSKIRRALTIGRGLQNCRHFYFLYIKLRHDSCINCSRLKVSKIFSDDEIFEEHVKIPLHLGLNAC